MVRKRIHKQIVNVLLNHSNAQNVHFEVNRVPDMGVFHRQNMMIFGQLQANYQNASFQ